MNGNKRSIRRLHRLPTLARAARLRRFPSSKRACGGRVAGGGSSERRGITTKFSSAGNRLPAERNGNRLTFAPLCAKGRNLRGEGPCRGAFLRNPKRSAGRPALSAIARYSLLALGLYAWGATPSRA